MRYAQLIDDVWNTPLVVSDGVVAVVPPELELQAIWYAGGFGRDFITTEGKVVRVVQFGEWNRGAGPDFQHVAVEINGEHFHGALELDPYASDWENHHHAMNPSYRDVILHVSFRKDSGEHFIRNDEHRMIPQVVIDEHALSAALHRPRSEGAIARPGRCVAPLRAMTALDIESLLEEACRYRATLKTKRFSATAEVHGRDAALFQAVAQTLGYRGNALPMQLLAQRAPLKNLREIGDAIEAALFGTAGFLSPAMHEKAEGATRDYLSNLWADWWKHRAGFESTRAIPWKMHGQRPANHPHRRVATLSILAQQWSGFRKVALARPFSAKKVIDFLATLTHPFWNFHHTLSSKPTPKAIALFGKTQALELIANHLAPLAMQEDATFSYEKFAKLRSSTRNEKLRRVAIRLFGSEALAEPWLHRLVHQQALLQIYQDFCLEDVSDCAQCPFPEQLAQWHS